MTANAPTRIQRPARCLDGAATRPSEHVPPRGHIRTRAREATRGREKARTLRHSVRARTGGGAPRAPTTSRTRAGSGPGGWWDCSVGLSSLALVWRARCRGLFVARDIWRPNADTALWEQKQGTWAVGTSHAHGVRGFLPSYVLVVACGAIGLRRRAALAPLWARGRRAPLAKVPRVHEEDILEQRHISRGGDMQLYSAY